MAAHLPHDRSIGDFVVIRRNLMAWFGLTEPFREEIAQFSGTVSCLLDFAADKLSFEHEKPKNIRSL